jgi:L,D-transpeptidase YcbB
MSYNKLIYLALTLLFISFSCTGRQNRGSGNMKDTINYDAIRVNDYEITLKDYHEKLDSFYINRDYKTAWFRDGRLSGNAFQLLEEIRNSGHPGLDAANYGLFRSGEWLEKDPSRDFARNSPSEIARYDILLSDAFLSYASDLSEGRVTGESLDILVEEYPKKVNLPVLLEEAVTVSSVKRSLSNLVPHHESYYSLVEAYDELKEDEEWPLPGKIPALKLNSKSTQVPLLKKYLLATGDLEEADSAYLGSTAFDEKLHDAVMRFQERHGLEADGITGEKTVSEMNVPLSYRLNQLLVNIDRLRALPADLGNRYIIVNIPGFHMNYFEDDDLKLGMNVVVGELENYTPLLKDTMSYIVFNPEWNVPFSIATGELLPEIKDDPEYLDRNDYVLLEGSYSSSDTINPDDVRWRKIDEENFKFFVVRKPGPSNPLGKIKFMFPNNAAIYMHDTPSDHLFEKTERDLSHGCVRLEKPVELAYTLLDGQLKPDEIDELLEEEETVSVPLDKKVSVHFLYETAWVDNEGRLQFRNDLYGIDEASAALLNHDK